MSQRKTVIAVKITVAGVKLSGFSISNDGPGLYTTGVKIIASQTAIEDCTVFDTPVGIAVWSSKNTISNCIFYGCEDEGIAFLGSATSNCNDNLVTNCVFYDNCDGIELQYSSNNVISYCEFYDNTHAASML
ncbi:Right handed beta helix region [Thermoplasmatales archaeon SCGC AB-540-F20]|nr:Right handed beta helix region [Thermoplasmatales archaeon SCGC AB-540-F20]